MTGFHDGLCIEPHSRRAAVVAALQGSAREACLAYSIYEALLWMDHSALFIGNTGTRADRAGETVDAIETEIRRIARKPTQNELDEAKSYLKGSQMLALDTSSKLAQRCCSTSSTDCRSTTSRSATPSSTR